MTERTLIISVVSLSFLLGTEIVFGQSPTSAPASSDAASTTAKLDLYVKVIGAGLTAIAALIGLPIVFLTYRKTRAEIKKLELEASALQTKQSVRGGGQKDDEGNIRIQVDQSPNTTIQVLADPRFLAPLLILLDFILASIVLTLVDHLFSIFPVRLLRAPTLALLTAILLLPIARQVFRVRALLRPSQTEAEIRAAQHQFISTGYTLYVILCLALLGFGVLILTVSDDGLTELGWYLAWILIVLGVLLISAVPFAKRRFDRFVLSMHVADIRDAP